MVFSCKDIKKSFGAEDVLTGVSFIVEEGERTAVVGVNGAGKTTLFRIMNGELLPDGGELYFKKGSTSGYLSQTMELDGNNTAYEEILSVFAGVIELENEIRLTEREMSRSQGNELNALMNKYAKLTAEFEEKRGYEYESRVRGVIKGLGISEEECSLKLSMLSGGQKTRVALGKLLLAEPDIMLLDEPTNHLDMDAVAWLEEYVTRSYSGSLVIISHDRYFLDKTVTKVIEIENGASEVYYGNYSYFAYKKEIDRDIKLKQYIDQQKEIKRQEEIIKRFRSYNREWSIKKAESREKALAKIERFEKPRDDKKIRIMLEPKSHCGHDVLHIENVSKAFDRPLFENVNFDIKRGEAVALVGPNGVGKTTLFNMILGKSFGGGIIRLGAGVKIGYYDQEQITLDDSKTIFDEISDAFPEMKNVEIRTALAAFMFCGDDVFKVIGALSGGEKGRVSLAKLMLGRSNFLLLDEPTNHLDIFSREILEEAVRNYTGTIFYISHDRYFIQNTADVVIELSPAGAEVYRGDYEYFLEKKEEKRQAAAERQQAVAAASQNTQDWKRKKDEASAERKKQARLQRLENEIAKAEKSLENVNRLLMLDEIATDAERLLEVFNEKTALENRVHELYIEWDAESGE